ncbi:MULTISPECIES: ABC transporter ATP-binding protein [Aeromonas]|uniref:ABC transporter ATP-binding protein n=1 Tax=Aeromonas TaxID=642 RepID=UPI0004D48090|nr:MULTISPECIES: ABC transporter ATP-binding protein [Aeromonas]KDV02993.1 ABC transporter ATP-binding protein [Aeromonas sp. HZM]MCF5901553.1 ABC transporter ATP-binding protein [Aeromonas veronii]MCX0436619.1 ABC transporter ATP-binding protein [Aeromonas veronii]HDX8427938.1 ABC transporter ATP-binding protein [Aeromonas veronii]
MLKVENVSKKFNISRSPWRRIFFNLGIKSAVKSSEFFHALDNISFSISKGETVGIIGKNGAGKSTLLQIICGTLKASTGNVSKPKKIAALLELGAGFNPEYTGRENISLNGSLIGMSSKEIAEKEQEIINFSEILDFIDRPVKTYSSGMFARLAFSIAVHSSPDLLIVDEALSVGDMAFQEKSINKMKELRDSGIPIFFVSHSIPMVRNFCTRAIWLEHGKIKMDASAKDVCSAYMRETMPMVTIESKQALAMTPSSPKLRIKDFNINSDVIETGGDLIISFAIELIQPIPQSGIGIGVIVRDSSDKIVSIFSTVRDSVSIKNVPKSVVIDIKNIPLLFGNYSLSVSITDELNTFHYDRIDYLAHFNVVVPKNEKGLDKYEGLVAIVDHSWKLS